jgi:5'-methylthioadenosine phosphorylase
MSESVVLGVIGGSGLYQMEGADTVTEHALDTPYGKPSDAIVEAKVEGRSVYFLPRHGKGHKLLPSEVPARANIHAFKQLGVTHVLAVSACGIMREEIKPGDMVVPDQIFDRTRGLRPSTFFGEGVVGHLPFADPFCEELREVIIEAGKEAGAELHAGGTYICMEGPLFSTRAESNFYRKAVDASVIGMTALPEAKLAREAELCYAMLAMGTDYDCWHEEEEDVTIDQILAVMKANGALANRIVADVAARLPTESDCTCLSAAQYAIVTDRASIPAEAKERLRALYGKYLD